jgi:hypothetical protein
MPTTGNVNALPALIDDIVINRPIIYSCDLQAVRFLFQIPVAPEAPFGRVALRRRTASSDRPGTAAKSGI